MNIMKSAVLAATLLAVPVAANAATVGFTEGNRSLVAGTTRISEAPASPASTTFNLGGGDTVNLFGVIVGDADTYTINAATSFTVSFNFDGYTLRNGRTVQKSGFVARNPRQGNGSVFSLVGGSTDLTKYFRTNIVSGDPLIFSADAGTYTFSIDNRSSNPSKPARYDLAFVASDISAVPLPAGGLMLLSALGAAAVVRRRKKALA